MSWLTKGLAAVDPEKLTQAALEGQAGPATVIAIGKAASAMARGAARAMDPVDGLCITNHPTGLPAGIEVLVGDHPVPGRASLTAGCRALEVAPHADLALISGGGSSLCEVPAEGLDMEFLAAVNRKLLDAGVSITQANLVRTPLSRIKGGGLGPLPTLVLSDVAGADPAFVSSGPTIPAHIDAGRVLETMKEVGIEVTAEIEAVIRRRRQPTEEIGSVKVIGDGRTAALATAHAVAPEIAPARVRDGWLGGPFERCLRQLITGVPGGVTVAAGEPSVRNEGDGRGGRNTHAALRAAQLIAGTDMVFAALATDGEDGSSGSAGAIVDGTTVSRGGDPTRALAGFDSAGYLGSPGDLIEMGPTGTNVADLWLIWKPHDQTEPILAV
jgi:hydroxypyruvate reductase